VSVSSISLLECKIIAASIVVVSTELETQMGGRVERISKGEMSVGMRGSWYISENRNGPRTSIREKLKPRRNVVAYIHHIIIIITIIITVYCAIHIIVY